MRPQNSPNRHNWAQGYIQWGEHKFDLARSRTRYLNNPPLDTSQTFFAGPATPLKPDKTETQKILENVPDEIPKKVSKEIERKAQDDLKEHLRKEVGWQKPSTAS